MSSKKQCPCGKTSSCPQHSAVKMVAYDKNDKRIVWYSFFKEERKFKNRDKLADSMGERLKKKYGGFLNIILYYDNLIDVSAKPFKMDQDV